MTDRPEHSGDKQASAPHSGDKQASEPHSGDKHQAEPPTGRKHAGRTRREKTGKQKIAVGIACALWGSSIVLSFYIPPSSANIWLPDAVLLLGFIPLILICPYSLIWLAFGILTAFIGFFLLMLINIPDSALPAQTLPVKKHLYDYHPWGSWLIIGSIVTICGTIRLLINGLRLILKRQRRKASE